MFERFDEDARAAVVAAQEEARALGHNHVGTEHLLLGVVAVPGAAAGVLGASGLSRERVRIEIIDVIGVGESTMGPADADALATIGIDLDEVRRRAEAAFGPGALSAPLAPHRRRRRTWWRRRNCTHMGLDETARLVPDSARGSTLSAIPFTPRSKESLELAVRQAVALGHAEATVADLALGILGTEKGLATEILDRAGVDRGTLRDALVRLGPNAA